MQSGLADETDRYYYRIVPLGNNGVMQYADPKSDQHIAYLGGVFVSEDISGDYATTVSILCEPSVETAIFTPLSLLQNQDSLLAAQKIGNHCS